MTAVTLWTAALCKPDPGYGGWAYVRRNADGTLAGAAGGERRVTGPRMVLTGLIEALTALADLPAQTAVKLYVAEPSLAAELVATDGAYALAEPDAWAAARKLLAAGPVLTLTPLTDAAPAAGFLKAWADFGLDTAKTRGSFKAAIPKPNLLKFPG
ncbi:MAG: ribonuclease H [Gemmatimonadaceae bacterium]|nr:ribonuclease H [Caulobacter sp.]